MLPPALKMEDLEIPGEKPFLARFFTHSKLEKEEHTMYKVRARSLFRVFFIRSKWDEVPG